MNIEPEKIIAPSHSHFQLLDKFQLLDNLGGDHTQPNLGDSDYIWGIHSS